MKTRRGWLSLLTLGVALSLPIWPALAADPQALQTRSVQAEPSAPPLPPPPASPVALFRELLAKSPAERLAALANRPPTVRDRILTKVQEYQRLTPEERELRLLATELRWYLTPLLSLAPTNRAVRLEQIPAALRPLVEARLAFWNVLPPPLQAKVLEEDRHLQLYLQLAGSSAEQRQVILSRLPEAQRQAAATGFARWQEMSDVERGQAMERVNRYFELQPKDKRQVLARLTETQRQQMEQSLAAFEKLPKDKRSRCLQAFPKFASLSPEERAEFLVNAGRWQALSVAERDLFRRMVQQAPAQAPPPLPPRPAAATNRG